MKAIQKEFNSYIGSWMKESLSPEVRELIAQAYSDLYFGPLAIGEEGYPGFERALEIIEQELANAPTEVYVEECGYVCEGEPQPWKDEETGEFVYPMYYSFNKKDVLSAILGKELATYL